MKPIHLLLAMLSLSCGGGGTTIKPPCCTPATIARDFGYVGSYATDGGAPTQVQLIISNGEARLSLLRSGNEVVQTFQMVAR